MANELAVREGLTNSQIELLKRTIAKGSTDDELQLFIAQCNRTGLDPFAKQIYAIKRWNSKERKEDMAFQTSIDGYRLIAERTNKYEGSVTLWCGDDGIWKDVWLLSTPPVAAKCEVYKTGARIPFAAVALWSEYAQYTKEGGLTSFWKTKPALMLGKCAESQALRKAFPQELSGLYTTDEMPEPAPYIESSARGVNEDTGEIIETRAIEDKNPDAASEKSVKYMHVLGREKFGDDWKNGAGKDFLMETVGKESTKGMTQAEVSAVIDALKEWTPPSVHMDDVEELPFEVAD